MREEEERQKVVTELLEQWPGSGAVIETLLDFFADVSGASQGRSSAR